VLAIELLAEIRNASLRRRRVEGTLSGALCVRESSQGEYELAERSREASERPSLNRQMDNRDRLTRLTERVKFALVRSRSTS
jgi:hypothetical protein